MDDAIFVSWSRRSTVHGSVSPHSTETRGERSIPAAAQAFAAHPAALVLVGDDALAADEFSA